MYEWMTSATVAMFWFLLCMIVTAPVHVYVFQLPQQENYIVGLHTVMSVLRLAATKLYSTFRTTNPQQAYRTRSTHLHSEGGESNKDISQSVSSAATSSSEYLYLLPWFCSFSENLPFNTPSLWWHFSWSISSVLAWCLYGCQQWLV